MTPTRTGDLAAAAEQAYIFSLPLFSMEAFRQRCLANGDMNELVHGREFYDHTNRIVTTPNNDTLYSMGWLDLREHSVKVTIPDNDGRYLTLAFMDMYTNNFMVLGENTTGTRGGTFTVIGPDASSEGLDGPVIRAPTSVCMIIARVLVVSEQDLEAAHALQNGFAVEASGLRNTPVPTVASTSIDVSWQDYFSTAAQLLAMYKPYVSDLAATRKMAPLELDDFDPARFSATEAAEIAEGFRKGQAALSNDIARIRGLADGWIPTPLAVGDFGQDYLLRARVSVSGLGALNRDEAVYFVGSRFNGAPLEGTKPMRWHIPAGKPLPAKAFWSLTMYEFNEAGERYFTDNPIRRYAIGDRTPGLRRNEDGSLDIWISHAHPGEDRASNWLPAPAGKYNLTLRTYRPEPSLLNRIYQIPNVTPAE